MYKVKVISLKKRQDRRKKIARMFQHIDFEFCDGIDGETYKLTKFDKEFVKEHVAFHQATTDIGYGLRPEHALEKKAKNNGKTKGAHPKISFEEYAKSVKPYTLEKIGLAVKEKLEK